jgi:hypothetical protein
MEWKASGYRHQVSGWLRRANLHGGKRQFCLSVVPQDTATSPVGEDR